jgi:hypothetical protein
MKKISLSLLVVLLFIFALASIAQAFQNEPAGFRGLKWGDKPTEDMWFSYQVAYKDDYLQDINGNYYDKIGDNPYIGNVKLYSIYYIFNLCNNQFYRIQANFYDEINYDILKTIFKDKFGTPTKEEKYFLYWGGEKVYIHILFKSTGYGKGYGYFQITSEEFYIKNVPEIDKQKEVEKAKDDF